MAKRGSLVSQVLERVSGELFESHPKLVRSYAHGQAGVYALYSVPVGKTPRLYYVGLASNLRGRLKTHLKDRHRGRWNRFSLYLVRDRRHIKELESLLLRIAHPPGNSQKGRFVQCEDLRRGLKRAIKQEQRIAQMELLGSNDVRRGRGGLRAPLQRKTRPHPRRGKEASLAPYLDRFLRPRLRVRYKGRTYKARVLRDGRISIGGKKVGSPSLAAREIRAKGSGANGWHFWRYERGPDNWVRLNEIRR